MRVLLVAPNASARMGGEAILPLHWLRELRALGVDAQLLTHARCREELEASPYASMPIDYVEDSESEITVWRFTSKAKGLAYRSSKFALSFLSMLRLGQAVRKKAQAGGFDLIHQVTPVSPRLPSPIAHPSIPVLIGPMNGNMSFPAGFAERYGDGSEGAEGVARRLSAPMHKLFPGKPKAARTLVANQRTAQGLPPGVPRTRNLAFVENGVDLGLWKDTAALPEGPARFIFVGRLVNWKAVDILLGAFAELSGEAVLTICGDGAERASLEAQADRLGIADRVRFLGAVPQEEVRREVSASHVLVLPSVYECGGAVVLEAMAMRRAVIATDWGGPADYVTAETGILVPPTSPEGLREGLKAAMADLASDRARIRAMGEAGRARIEEHFAWKTKGERMLAVYEEVLAERA